MQSQKQLAVGTADYKGMAGATHKVKAGLKLLEAKQLVVLTEQMCQRAREEKEPEEIRKAFDLFVLLYPSFKEKIQIAFQKVKDSK